MQPKRGGVGAWLLGILVCCLADEATGGDPALWYFDSPPLDVTNFLLGGLQPRTQQLYAYQWSHFMETTGLGQQWARLALESRDFAVAQYLVHGRGVEVSDDDHVSRTQGGYLLAHLRYREPHGSYALSWRVLGVWKSRDPPGSAWPLTPALTEALAATFCLQGEVGGGLACMICFAMLLRMNEALNSLWGEWYLPDAEDTLQEGALYLPQAKTGAHQYVPITDPRLINELRNERLRQRRRGGGRAKDRVFKIKYGRFRTLFIRGLEVMKLPPKLYRSHSLRRGGATFLLQHVRSIEYVVHVGRWASLQSARKYLKQGEALLARQLAERSLEGASIVAALRAELGEFFPL
jgi:hypothetical protein